MAVSCKGSRLPLLQRAAHGGERRDDGGIRFLPGRSAHAGTKSSPSLSRCVAECCVYFARSALLDAEDARDMLAWDNQGFSLDAAVRIGDNDRAALGDADPPLDAAPDWEVLAQPQPEYPLDQPVQW